MLVRSSYAGSKIYPIPGNSLPKVIPKPTAKQLLVPTQFTWYTHFSSMTLALKVKSAAVHSGEVMSTVQSKADLLLIIVVHTLQQQDHAS